MTERSSKPRAPGRLLSLAVAGTVAALVGYGLGRRGHGSPTLGDGPLRPSLLPSPRNARLTYRPLGTSGEPYPDWVRALKGKSGVYVIRELGRDGSSEVVYVGESHTGRLYQTLTRHFQAWRRSKKFWTGLYGGQGHDPGLTYPRDRVTVATSVLKDPERAMSEERRLIAALRPRDNLLGQPNDEPVPF